MNLQASGIEFKHLKRYILAHRCDACEVAPGRRDHKVEAKRKFMSTPSSSTTIAPATATATETSNPLTENLDLEFSTITHAVDLTVTMIKSFARLQGFQCTSMNPSDYLNFSRSALFRFSLPGGNKLSRCAIFQTLPNRKHHRF